jgi:hypothetical protein
MFFPRAAQRRKTTSGVGLLFPGRSKQSDHGRNIPVAVIAMAYESNGHGRGVPPVAVTISFAVNMSEQRCNRRSGAPLRHGAASHCYNISSVIASGRSYDQKALFG